jgi:serine/threonine kinase 38
MKKMKKDEMD